jgi:hypothetical protein
MRAPLNDWSRAFGAYLTRSGRTQLEASVALGIAPSAVHYWVRGSIPRPLMRRRIERWSNGAVPARLGVKADAA